MRRLAAALAVSGLAACAGIGAPPAEKLVALDLARDWLRIDADFAAGARTASGAPLEDFLADRIEPRDPLLVAGTLVLRRAGRVELTASKHVRVWREEGGAWIRAGAWDVAEPAKVRLRVQGVEGSPIADDAFVRAKLGAASDEVRLTVVATEFMLTFDDGPFAEKTERVLRDLERVRVRGERVKAAFFEVGRDGSGQAWWDVFSKHIEGVAANASVTRAVAAAGHFVGNHTAHHKSFFLSSEATVAGEIEDGERAIEAALGGRAERLFRPPYFTDSSAVRAAARAKGYELVWGEAGFEDLWADDWRVVAQSTADYLEDWNWPEQPQRHAWPAVICWHEYHEVVNRHVAELVADLRSRGFVLVDFDPRRLRTDSGDYR